MARKKLVNRETPQRRVTRSKASFNLLDGLDDEFPTLDSTSVGLYANAGVSGADCNTPSKVLIVDTIDLQIETTEQVRKVVTSTSANKEEPAKQITLMKTKYDTSERKPWNTLFKDNRAPTHGLKLKYVPPKENGLDVTDRIFPSMVKMWSYCLVGCFTGIFPGLKAVHELRVEWGVKCQVRRHNRGWVIFKFQSECDRAKVLNGGPYSKFEKLLMLKPLHEDFSFVDEEFLKVSIWVKFPNLPLKLWSDDAMSEVVSMVGVPLTTDKVTQEKSNHHFARVLIEVDVSNPPQLSFPIRLPSHKVFKQHVVYKTFPSFCFHCKEYGHHPFTCKVLAEKELSKGEAHETKGATDLETTAAGAISAPDGADFEATAAATEEPDAILEEPGVASHVQPSFEATVAGSKVQPAAGTIPAALVPMRMEHAAVMQSDDGTNTTAIGTIAAGTSAAAVQSTVAAGPQISQAGKEDFEPELAAAGMDGQLEVREVATALQFPEVVIDRNKIVKNMNKNKRKKKNTGRPKTMKSGGRTPKRIENESSGETEISWEEDVGSDFDEVYMDGKVFTIRKDDKVCRNRMIRRIPGLSWEDTFTKKKMDLPEFFRNRKNGKK
ncbi:unnamed protein product [Cuscuta europaea]|uniref:DUF4283 domain-containing protein n=1 Tax=Cuscuta europaea TaxID=41803 RepID=A0A9P0ZPT9_CUSEU|nr:unnamed protein product [Cuscuta europaea]